MVFVLCVSQGSDWTLKADHVYLVMIIVSFAPKIIFAMSVIEIIKQIQELENVWKSNLKWLKSENPKKGMSLFLLKQKRNMKT
jgi:hypothetical protein